MTHTPRSEAVMVRWVLHLHLMSAGAHTPGGADASWHYDWMVGPWPGLAGQDGHSPPEARVLRSWRLGVEPWRAGQFEAEDGPLHRAAYLDIEDATLSGDRGTVRRVAHGSAEVLAATPDRVELILWVLERIGQRSALVVSGRPDPARNGWWLFRAS